MNEDEYADVIEKYPVWKGSTVSTSGSAIVPENNSSIYRNLAKSYNIYKNDPNEATNFKKEIREFLIAQIKKDADRDDEIYQTQKRYGITIFIVVILLVFSGIGFSIIQFINAMRLGQYNQLMTSIEVQATGSLALSTSLVGAFVLVVSLIFFFLFLQFVYKPNNKHNNYFEKIDGFTDKE